MKKLGLLILVAWCFISCERKPLYLQGEYAFNIQVQTQASIDLLWDPFWRDSLRYDWNEEILGKIGYSTPKHLSLSLFKGGEIIKEQNLELGKYQPIDLELGRLYSALIVGNSDSPCSFSYQGGRYYAEAPERVTKAETIADRYRTVEQPEEVFVANLPNIRLSDNSEEYETIYINGKNVFVYNIDATLEPVSYIYIIQFIVINDDKSEDIEAKGIGELTISGVASKKDLLSRKSTYTGLNQIKTEDIKEGQYREDSLLFASRVTVLDLLPDDENYSWSSQQNYLYYTVLSVDTHNFGQVTGVKDITEQLNKNPHGGIITVRILNSEIKEAGSNPGSGFGVSLGEWEHHIIDIPF